MDVMGVDVMGVDDLLAWASLPDGVGDAPDGPLVAIDCRGATPDAAHRPAAITRLAERLDAVPAMYVAVGAGDDDPIARVLDVVVDDDDQLASLAAAVEANPLAAVSLAVLLRRQPDGSVADGLLAESATYALLQAGPEHQRWLSSRPAQPAPRGDDVRAVVVERDERRLRITLDRPYVHNAFDSRMRDGLLEALIVGAADPSIQLVLEGAGPTFCSGGDLDEFGTVSDPPTAHLIRLRRSVGRVLASVADRTTVRVHGPCVGAGVEIPAFAGRVHADPDTTFRLPEVSMGLVPGAGGTVSLPRRIGRQRTAYLALTGATVDAPTALAWGLVDQLAPHDHR